jgi:hypothetical protein
MPPSPTYSSAPLHSWNEVEEMQTLLMLAMVSKTKTEYN